MKDLITFELPETIDEGSVCRTLGEAIIAAWQSDGIFQVAMAGENVGITERAFMESRRFFALPFEQKRTLVSELTYSGYIASREEITAGENDYSEIFTVCPDLPVDDPSVRAGWPCHGPVPWPSEAYGVRISEFMTMLSSIGERLLRLAALGLHEEMDAFTRLTRDGWHHMRVLRFPTEQSSGSSRGIGSHTDYGLLVIAAQDDVGGLYIRPPIEGEIRKRNWLIDESSAGMYEDDNRWTFVKPVPKVLTVFPGDFLQFMTSGKLLSTPHRVCLNTRERFAMAYFHEPNFDAFVRPLDPADRAEPIHYGNHFTRMFMRSYPERITTQRIEREDLLSLLPKGKPRT